MSPALYYGPGCEPIATFAEHYQWMLENHMFKNDFSTPHLRYPIGTEQTEELINAFVMFYPVYDSYIQIACGQEVRFNALLQALNTRIKEIAERPEETEPNEGTQPADRQTLSQSELLKIKEVAAERVKVMPAMRWQVLQRDQWRCVACGRKAADGVTLHVDHILPRSKGGSNTIENYQTLCDVCNFGKGNRDDTDLRNL